MKTLLAIDPGQRTGVAVFKYDDTDVWIYTSQEVYGGVEGMWAWLRQWDFDSDTTVVIEDFLYNARKPSVDLTPVRVIGLMEGFCLGNDLLLVKQPPAGRKEAVSNEALKRAGWFYSGEPNRNRVESVRHGAWWLKKQRHVPTLTKLFGGPTE